jgi:hypothetical protein
MRSAKAFRGAGGAGGAPSRGPAPGAAPRPLEAGGPAAPLHLVCREVPDDGPAHELSGEGLVVKPIGGLLRQRDRAGADARKPLACRPPALVGAAGGVREGGGAASRALRGEGPFHFHRLHRGRCGVTADSPPTCLPLPRRPATGTLACEVAGGWAPALPAAARPARPPQVASPVEAERQQQRHRKGAQAHACVGNVAFVKHRQLRAGPRGAADGQRVAAAGGGAASRVLTYAGSCRRSAGHAPSEADQTAGRPGWGPAKGRVARLTRVRAARGAAGIGKGSPRGGWCVRPRTRRG